jgi:hypothetical protein
MAEISDLFLKGKLSEFLGRAADMYGPRVEGITVNGIWYEGNTPRCETSSYPMVRILLTEEADGNRDRSLFQLSHECVHAVCGTRNDAPLIEEGAAVQFSIVAPRYQARDYATRSAAGLPPCYMVAHHLFRRLRLINRNAIRLIREQVASRRLDEITPTMIQAAVEGVPDDLAAALVLPLPRWQEAVQMGASPPAPPYEPSP